MPLRDWIELHSLREKLDNGGYQTLEELKQTSILELTKELQLSTEEVEYVIKVCGREPTTVQKRTLAEIIAAEQENSITTLSKNVDTLLGGHGIPPFKITELCGEPGSGKTQLCMQLAVNVQLDKEKGGVDGECLYIDTEGSFQVSRYINIGRRHFSIEKMLKSIHVFRILDHSELIAMIRQLPDIMQHYPKIKLVIIDSIAYHFRLNVLDARARTAILNYTARMLIELAKVYTLSVVVTNHVASDGYQGPLTPSLGSEWGYWCANRLFLFRRRHYRFGFLYKAVENENSRPVQFHIREEGIGDPEEEEVEVVKKESDERAEWTEEMDSAWEEVKQAKIKEEEEAKEFEDIWNDDAVNDRLISQIDLGSSEKGAVGSTVRKTDDNDNDNGDDDNEKQCTVDEGFIPSSQIIAEGVPSLFDAESSPLSEPSEDVETGLASNKRKINVEKESRKRCKQTTHESCSIITKDEKTNDTTAVNDDTREDVDRGYWDSDLEESLDWDFLQNVESYL
ncbi:P-loop containing nucleoside triphosphate hydrolase protein [Mycotypha africana]|uniref:P-loop containing nucleoside triphosphate hydrolase protein n=1 Tax=Mycotypha africana TaxID=64632 RepID=UPI0022FFC4D9|nr:P-loop containing nucleoside triphosphate hydrolase protein [Mycotypha africana]KAI8969217.1 P-loop containing nucleoside triphosphate hydrolase protein [Mycotypha africana]